MKYNILNKKFKYTYKNVCSWLLMINLIVFVLTDFMQVSVRGIPLKNLLSLIPGCINYFGWVWQFFTYMFVHSGMTHIFFNMYALFVFGSMLERWLGSREFILFYLLTGTLGGVICYLVNLFSGNMNIAILGASGAIYALLFLTSVLFPTNRVLLFFVIPLKMPVAVILFIAIEVFSEVTGSAAGISHLTHLSSMLIAWLYCLVRFRISPVKVWREALKH